MATNNPNWPSRTGNPSGGGRGNNPPKKYNVNTTYKKRKTFKY